jgi:hypothetical protein
LNVGILYQHVLFATGSHSAQIPTGCNSLQARARLSRDILLWPATVLS